MIPPIVIGLGFLAVSLIAGCKKEEKKPVEAPQTPKPPSSTECYPDKPVLRECTISDVKKARESLMQLMYKPNNQGADLLFLKGAALAENQSFDPQKDEELHQRIKQAQFECVEMYLSPGGDRCRYDDQDDYLSLTSALSLFDSVQNVREKLKKSQPVSIDEKKLLDAYEKNHLQAVLRRPAQALKDKGYPDIVLSAGILKSLFPDLPPLNDQLLSGFVDSD